MKYIVYCTTCLKNGKIYIGVHKTENPDVFDGYIGNGLNVGFLLKNPKTAFQHAVKKYGYNNFKRAVLFVFDSENEAYEKEKEIVTLDFIKRKDNYNVKTGGIGGSYPKLWIYRYHLDGTYWEEFLGYAEISERFNCDQTSVYNACKNQRSFKSSYWSFKKQTKLNIEQYHLSKFSTIYQFDTNGNLIKEWDCIKDICVALDTTKSNIISALHKKSLAKKYYFTRDKNEIYNILKTKDVYNTLPKIKPGQPRKIAQYDLNEKLIKIWDNIKSCAREYSKCREVAKGILKSTKGFIFKYIS